MKIITAATRTLVVLAGILVTSIPASAQVLSVTPTSVTATGTAGVLVASKSVNVKNSTKGALKWSVSPPTASWVKVSPTGGTQSGTLTVSFPTTFSAGNYSASFVVSGNGQSQAVSVNLTIGAASAPPPPPPPPTLVVSCPANISTTSSNGSPVAVTYSPTASGGIAPVTVTASPVSGSSFPVGTTPVSVSAHSSDNQNVSCGFSVTVTYTPSNPPPSGVGPQSSITCPAGAVDIFPGSNIQNVVNQFAGATTFCLRAGTHSITSAITPKTGNTFVGQYGAIIDGSGWATTDPDQGAFRSHNQDIDDVTIRNLVIRNMPQQGIHTFYMYSDRWTIEYNEITNTKTGVAVPNGSMISHNYIHNTTVGGYSGWLVSNTTFDTNEFAYNGPNQKVIGSNLVAFRNNYFHNDSNNGVFYDSSNTNSTIEGNRIEDEGGHGIFYEVSGGAVIRNNTVRRSGDTAIFISTSQSVQIYGNTLENNFRSVQYFLNCSALADGYDLTNNTTHDNTIRLDTTSGAFANGLNYLSSCTSAQYAPYMNGQKNLTFTNNHYFVPSMTTKYWVWGLGQLRFWSDWQSLLQDLTGTLN